ncbi:hypothetical protein VNO77_13830 [Canavalia gladiata]|uniref:Uncharacterized protein n=1 Tax=Canavalia gladiata TaxID=3824 RepID=A0AAN9LY91_CANGL
MHAPCATLRKATALPSNINQARRTAYSFSSSWILSRRKKHLVHSRRDRVAKVERKSPSPIFRLVLSSHTLGLEMEMSHPTRDVWFINHHIRPSTPVLSLILSGYPWVRRIRPKTSPTLNLSQVEFAHGDVIVVVVHSSQPIVPEGEHLLRQSRGLPSRIGHHLRVHYSFTLPVPFPPRAASPPSSKSRGVRDNRRK